MHQSDLYRESIARFNLYNSYYMPFTCVLTHEEAMLENKLPRTKAKAYLNGIPFGIKDIFNTRTLPTEMGSKIWKNFIAGNNARCIDHLTTSGALAFGKTVTAEFAVHALNETLNPYNIDRTPGTSSSGSAVAVALGIVPFAIGSQTAASIIRPASFCGVWGMKPSFGLIPRTGVLKTTDSLDTVGFFSFFGSDLKRILSVMRVKGPDYPYVYKSVDSRGPKPKSANNPWRVGIFRSQFWHHADEEVRDALSTLANTLANDVNIDVVEVSESPGDHIHNNHSIIYDKSLAYYFEQEAMLADQVSKLMLDAIHRGSKVSPIDYKLALKQQAHDQQFVESLYCDYDVLLTLSTATTAPKRNIPEQPDPSLIWTYLGMPAINIPFSLSSAGLPVGLQIVSKRYDDYLLLQFLEYIQSRSIVDDPSLRVKIESLEPK